MGRFRLFCPGASIEMEHYLEDGDDKYAMLRSSPSFERLGALEISQ
jgi:hypothetical protein